MKSLDRREFLGLGALGTAVAVGGCLHQSTDRDSYADWIPAGQEGQHVAYVDFGISAASETAQELFPIILPSGGEDDTPAYAPSFENLEDLDDPLLTMPLRMGGSQIGLYLLALSLSGLGHLVEQAGQPGGIQEAVVSNRTLVATGDFDVSRAREALRSDTSGFSGGTAHEQRGQHRDFAIYETTSTENESVVGLSGSAVVIADDRESVTTTIDAGRGERARATVRNDTFGWLFETAGDGHVAFGWERPVSLDRSSFGTAHERVPDAIVPKRHSAMTSIHFAPDDEQITARFALDHGGTMASATQEQLTSRQGTASTEVSTTASDGDRFSLTGTYDNDAIDVQYHEPGGGNGTDDQPDLDRNPPASVENAVPADAFSFSYDEERDRVLVTFRKQVDVDEITIRATESGNEISVNSLGNVKSLFVRLTPEDTEAVVIATVDGQSGVVASYTLPD